MDTSLKDQAQNKITQSENILIVVSKTSGLDGLASGLALFLSLKKLNKNTAIIAKAPTVNDARYLYGVDNIGKKSGSKNLVIGVKNAVKNVDKVTYFLEGDILKIIIHALPGSNGVTPEELSFGSTIATPDLLITVGYKDQNELGTDLAHEQQIDPKLFIININKEKPINKFAQIEVVDPSSPSLSETVAGFSQVLALPIDEDIAFNLYTGIASATQMFSPKLARPQTLTTSAWLLKFGAGKSGLAQEQRMSQTQADEVSQIDTGAAQTFGRDDAQPSEIDTTPIEQVEREKQGQEDWLKPPKMYRGSKSFDIES